MSGGGRMRETSIALGIDDGALQEEVLHFLDRLPHVKVVGAAERVESLRRLVRHRRPLAVVGVPSLLVGLEDVATLALSVRETTDALRTALRVGARGFYVWPEEREALGRDVQRLRPLAGTEPGEEGLVIAVLGARGGAGVTFLTTNLAGAFARRGVKTVLADLDLLSADVTPALGIPPEASHPTISDLAAVAGELTTEHLVRVLYEHPGGFRVLFAPGELSAEDRFDRATLVATVRALRERFGVTVVHLPRALDGAVRSVIELADIVLVVVSLDVVGIRMAKRLIDHLRSVGLAESMRLVINRAGRGEVVPQDAELVLETPIACVIGADRAVERAQNRGELIVERRGRLPRRIARLAEQLLDGRAA